MKEWDWVINYSNNLIKKKEIIVFNKIDMANTSDISEKVNFFKKKIKKNIYKISVIQKKNLETIKKILISNVYK